MPGTEQLPRSADLHRFGDCPCALRSTFPGGQRITETLLQPRYSSRPERHASSHSRQSIRRPWLPSRCRRKRPLTNDHSCCVHGERPQPPQARGGQPHDQPSDPTGSSTTNAPVGSPPSNAEGPRPRSTSAPLDRPIRLRLVVGLTDRSASASWWGCQPSGRPVRVRGPICAYLFGSSVRVVTTSTFPSLPDGPDKKV
jgi:hypothetical protein